MMSLTILELWKDPRLVGFHFLSGARKYVCSTAICDHLAVKVTPHRLKYIVSLWSSFPQTISMADIRHQSQHSFSSSPKISLRVLLHTVLLAATYHWKKSPGTRNLNGTCLLSPSGNWKSFATITDTCDKTLPHLVPEVFL